MKDQVFAGVDVPDAVRKASVALGVSVVAVRYVVLERGSLGGLGLAATPARIAVLLEGLGGQVAEGTDPQTPGIAETADAGGAILQALRELVRAGDLAVEAALVRGEGDSTIQIDGPDAGFFLQGEAEVLKSLDWVLSRIWDQAGEPGRLRVRVAGKADPREAALKAQAHALAAAARSSGQPQQSEPLNAWERRLIHVALAGEPGVKTFSVGAGADRRVTVALVDEPEPLTEA